MQQRTQWTIGARIRASLFGVEPLGPAEARSIPWAAAVVGIVLGTWYFIRPVRDEIASRQGVVLSALTTATFVVMLVAMPLYAAIVKRSTPRRLLPGVYGVFALMLVAFWAALTQAPAGMVVWVERAFFVWASVFSVFAVSVFWGLMADVFTEGQGKRFFGAVAAGGSLGGVLGSAAASLVLSPPASLPWLKVSPTGMLLIAAFTLLLSVLGLRGIHAAPEESSADAEVKGRALPVDEERIEGTIWASLAAPFRSPYLLGVCGYLFLYTVTSTFLYFQQTSIVGQAIADKAQRAAIFAQTDLVVNVVTFVAQLFLASRAMMRLGVGVTLCIVPVLTLLGFVGLTMAPVLWLVMGFQIVRRIANFALARPAREVLFTVVSREDKYKAKAFIDTVIYRAGDTVSGWLYAGLDVFGLGLALLAGVAAGISAAWVVVAGLLGRSHERMVARAAPRVRMVARAAPRVSHSASSGAPG
ncbi:NTP/NDP exchange transporter [Chondromyces apiculatus]|uniref:Putative inner membrane protein n=1 Tax=Chondromyces apiculatus DSM 436 TaxID=1192034 RepID=A0A017TI50_9BACT|nr:hypothetical protein [Chondromyces apiculatus]EYF08306.1 putative inner membrane protein [Chondromyces apiculatus DSM 436]